MKTVREIMTGDIIRLSPTNKIKTAIILMKGHNIGGLPVLEEDQVVGMLDYQDILGKDNDVLVQHIMDREFVTIPPDMPVADAADLMTKIGSGRLLVIEGGRLVGVVTRADLLPELGKSFDPITGLLRADAMRDWGITALKQGSEITLIFIDLDNFGQFNKKYGHITGDKVLKHVARVLQASVDPEKDLLCRYAGDEFVIVTVRDGADARELANLVGDRIRNTPNAELPEPVTGSIGVHGGKRTKEREQVHYEATLDNLINLASKSCTLAKGQEGRVASLNGDSAPPQAVATPPLPEVLPSVEPPPPPRETLSVPSTRLVIQGLNLSWSSGSMATAEVDIVKGETSRKHSRSGFTPGNNALRLVAEATAEAITGFLPAAGYGVVVETVNLVHAGAEEDVVLVTALLVTPQNQIRLAGSSMVRQDAYRAAAAAVLNAVNRQIASFI